MDQVHGYSGGEILTNKDGHIIYAVAAIIVVNSPGEGPTLSECGTLSESNRVWISFYASLFECVCCNLLAVVWSKVTLIQGGPTANRSSLTSTIIQW